MLKFEFYFLNKGWFIIIIIITIIIIIIIIIIIVEQDLLSRLCVYFVRLIEVAS